MPLTKEAGWATLRGGGGGAAHRAGGSPGRCPQGPLQGPGHAPGRPRPTPPPALFPSLRLQRLPGAEAERNEGRKRSGVSTLGLLQAAGRPGLRDRPELVPARGPGLWFCAWGDQGAHWRPGSPHGRGGGHRSQRTL